MDRVRQTVPGMRSCNGEAQYKWSAYRPVDATVTRSFLLHSFNFLVLARPGCPAKAAIKQVYVLMILTIRQQLPSKLIRSQCILNNNWTKCITLPSLHQCLDSILYTPLRLTHPFNGPYSWTTRVSRYQKGKTNQDFTEARVSEWQWHQLGHMQVCISLQTDNHAITPPLSFLQACPTNSV